MRKNKIIFLTIFILNIATIIFLFLFFKKKPKRPLYILKEISSLSDVKINQFQLQQANSKENHTWILKADSGNVYREKNIAECQNAKVKLIQNGKKKAILKSSNVIFFLNQNKVKLTGNVKSVILNNPASNNSGN